MATTETLIRLFAAPQQPGQCRGCGAAIVWFETVHGRRMPMNAGAVARKSEPAEASPSRVIAFYAASDAHWAVCPHAQTFHRKGSR
jgi:hypothetical protein